MSAIRDRAGHPRRDEPVIGELVTVLGDHAVLIVLDAVERSAVPSAALGRAVSSLRPRALELERLLDRH